ncbi:tetratricopeptide repeat protein [Vibrio lentus]|uniref:tetratricopeptide repeat protein n=1 Tax=Vibrio TaxID=662 RepID=UPI000C848627|nr:MULTISPECIES: hypothetical protein [Vibrio]PMO21125.1 hypothetical protein BCT15_15260 [Vibrio splendidus]WGS63048.1 hypothetical protein ISX51_23765 [Vibrio lentus]
MLKLNLFTTEELLALSANDLDRNELSLGLEKLKFMKEQGIISDELDSMLGSVYAKLKLFTASAESYSELLKRAPSRLHERFQLGMVYREIGEIDKAMENWEMVLVSEPNYPPVLFHKAVILLSNNEERESIRLLTLLNETAESDNYYVKSGREIMNELKSKEATDDSKIIDSVH